MATMTMVDNANGTATWSITGGLTLNGLNYFSLTGETGDRSVGTVYGSVIAGATGSLVVTLPVGHYMGVTISNPGTILSNFYEFRITDNTTGPVHYRCLEAIQDKIQSLGLLDLDSDSVIVRKMPVDKEIGNSGSIGLPAVVVSPLGIEKQSPTEGTNIRDDVGYPCVIAIVDVDNRNPTANHSKYLLWRQKINRAFRNQRLAGVNEIINCTVEPGPIIDPAAWQLSNLFLSTLTVRCVSREVRGLS